MISIDIIPDPLDPRKWGVKVFNGVLDYMFGSPQDQMKDMVKTVAEAQHAKGGGWFMEIYNDISGLAVLLALFGIIVYVFVAFGQPRYTHRWFNFAASTFKLLGVIAFAPMVVGMGIMISQSLTNSFVALGDKVFGEGKWVEPFTEGYGYDDFVGGGAIRFFTQIGGISLKLGITPQALLEYILLVLGVAAYVISRFVALDSEVNKRVWSMLLLVLCAQPLLVLILVLGGASIANQDASNSIKAIEVMFMTLICWAVLIGMYFGLKVMVTRVVKSKMDVEGTVKVEGDVTSEDIEVDIAEQRLAIEQGHQTVSEDPLVGEVIFHPDETQPGEPGVPSQSPDIVESTVIRTPEGTSQEPSDSPATSRTREILDRASEHADTAATAATASGHPEVGAAIMVANGFYGIYNFFQEPNGDTREEE